jgi:HK97 gp10 family phage protein
MTQYLTQDELKKRLNNVPKAMQEDVLEAMTKAAMNIEGEAKKYCAPSTTIYDRAPFITGALRRSISSHAKIQGKKIVGIVGAGVFYALFVHEGTSKMAARPFLLDAIKNKRPETIKLLSKGIEKAMKRAEQ